MRWPFCMCRATCHRCQEASSSAVAGQSRSQACCVFLQSSRCYSCSPAYYSRSASRRYRISYLTEHAILVCSYLPVTVDVVYKLQFCCFTLTSGYMCNLLHAICCMQQIACKCNLLHATNCMQQIVCNCFRIWAGLSLSISV